jgi:cytochrome bd-type quinol oxidase subunit 2
MFVFFLCLPFLLAWNRLVPFLLASLAIIFIAIAGIYKIFSYIMKKKKNLLSIYNAGSALISASFFDLNKFDLNSAMLTL